ncbi:MAG: TetR/AcrR family transcriptional regulator [bacterium]|nr:TetR/AcrR family transcriptional regulator [bacterium]
MPRQGLNRHKVLDAAMRVIDDHGLDVLTMRRLALELGVEAPSLYKHIAGKPDILDGIVEMVYEEIDFDGIEGSFRERVNAYASAYRTALLRHPNAVQLVAMRPVTGEHTIVLVERALQEMGNLGFDAQEGRKFLDVAVAFIVGHTLAEVGARTSDFDELLAARSELDDDRFPNVATTVAAHPVDHDAEFELGIGLIIDAIERSAAPIFLDLSVQA